MGIKLHCVGDSHVQIFKSRIIVKRMARHGVSIKIKFVGGATNIGLKNFRSKTKAATRFSEYIKKRVKPNDLLLFMMGEVDCGFLIWISAEKYGQNPEQQMKISLDNYFEFLQRYGTAAKQVIVCDAPPPTFPDNYNIPEHYELKEVGNLRHAIKATRRERTDLTLIYNKEIQKRCAECGYIHLGYSEATLNDAGVVSDKFFQENNHHLLDYPFAKLLRPLLVEKLQPFI